MLLAANGPELHNSLELANRQWHFWVCKGKLVSYDLHSKLEEIQAQIKICHIGHV